MNKHHGSKFDEYLKEKGRFEEISALAQKRWEELQADEPSGTSEIIEESPGSIARFFRWFQICPDVTLPATPLQMSCDKP